MNIYTLNYTNSRTPLLSQFIFRSCLLKVRSSRGLFVSRTRACLRKFFPKISLSFRKTSRNPLSWKQKDTPAEHTLSHRYALLCSYLLPRLRPGPTPSGIACSVCTVDLASCSNVMQCKENFCSLTGLPLNFPERIHPVPFVSQAKDFLFYRWIVCQKTGSE